MPRKRERKEYMRKYTAHPMAVDWYIWNGTSTCPCERKRVQARARLRL